MSIVLRSGTYYLRKRVPARFLTVEKRKEIWVSLKTDSKILAQEKAVALWDTLSAAWDAALRGNSADASERFSAASDIVRSRGFEYLPIEDVADLPLEQLLERVEALQATDHQLSRTQAPAILGLVPKPSISVSDALKEYWPLTEDKSFGKSQDQIRRWKNPRIKAIRNFIKVNGDVKLSNISAEHMLQYRAWHSERIQDGDVIGRSVNKEMTQLGHILKLVNEMKLLDLNLYLKSLKSFDPGDQEPRRKRTTMHNTTCSIWSREMKLQVSGKTGAIHAGSLE